MIKPGLKPGLDKIKKLDKNFVKRYEFNQKNKEFQINSFQRIGWQDPFPQDTFMMGTDADTKFIQQMEQDLWTQVYPEERINGYNSPQVIYIPNKAVMFKIMRACIGVKTKDELWINFKEGK